MEKRVLLIDDEPENWLSVEMLKEQLNGVRFTIGRDLYDADSYVIDDGIQFDMMIIDFALGEYEFEDWQDKEMYDAMKERKVHLVGWVWIRSFLRTHPDYDPQKIIGLSAYTDLLSSKEIASSGIQIIDKRERESEKKLLNAVKKIST